MIDGIVVRELKLIRDERGWLAELMRPDWETFEIGQVYLMTAYAGVVKAWHCYKHQTDNMVCVKGQLKLGLHSLFLQRAMAEYI